MLTVIGNKQTTGQKFMYWKMTTTKIIMQDNYI